MVDRIDTRTFFLWLLLPEWILIPLQYQAWKILSDRASENLVGAIEDLGTMVTWTSNTRTCLWHFDCFLSRLLNNSQGYWQQRSPRRGKNHSGYKFPRLNPILLVCKGEECIGKLWGLESHPLRRWSLVYLLLGSFPRP